MKYISIASLGILLLFFTNCSRNKNYDKGFAVGPESESSEIKEIKGIAQDTNSILIRPGNVLLTGHVEYRLTPVYKLNYDKRRDYYYTGQNNFYRNYSHMGSCDASQWHYNFMPGLQAVYGYNMVNVSLKNQKTQKQIAFFEKPVLIKTLYYPSFTQDSLFNQPLKRHYYMISVYDEDTNADGYINTDDLRRFYVFNRQGGEQELLIPDNYSVVSSSYDCANDLMYVFAQLDENHNGQREETEAVHIFWIDLNNPRLHGQQYE